MLMGPAHYVPVRGIAAPVVEAFETPLGPVRLDQEMLAAISGLPAIEFTDEPHGPEHAIEVELPFYTGPCHALLPCRCWSATRRLTVLQRF